MTPCDLCPDLTEEEARRNGALSYDFALSVLRDRISGTERQRIFRLRVPEFIQPMPIGQGCCLGWCRLSSSRIAGGQLSGRCGEWACAGRFFAGGRMIQERVSASEARALLAKPAKRKWRNQPVVIDGARFDSKGEARRWEVLRLMELAGEISELRRQVRVTLIGAGNMVLLYDSGRPAEYVADFAYIVARETKVTLEDFKGAETPESKLKRAIVAAMHGKPVLVSRAGGARA